MTVPVTSRIKVLDTPIMQPGTCSLCGSSGDGKRKFIDFGKQLDWYGAVYFCSECIIEVAMAIGYIPVAKLESLVGENNFIRIELDKLIKKHEAVVNAFNAVLVDHCCDHSDIAKPNNDVNLDLEKSNILAELDKKLEPGESETNESNNVERSDDLFDSTDFD